MASKMNVEPYAMFQRVDRDKDGLVSPLDLLQFLRECNFHGYHEADCYYLVKFFDSDSDLAMSYADFLQMVLPCNNELLRAIASQRPNETYVKVPGDIPEEVEKELALLIMMEIDMHRQSEPLKQELRCVKDYSDDSLIACIDSWGYGFVDPNNLKLFFKQNQISITEQQCMAIVRRFNLDWDIKLSH